MENTTSFVSEQDIVLSHKESLIEAFDWFKEHIDEALDGLREDGEDFEGIELEDEHRIQTMVSAWPIEYRKRIENSPAQFFLLLTCLSRYIHPEYWKPFYIKGNPFSLYVENEFVYPTPNTVLFILCGDQTSLRLQYSEMFNNASPLFCDGIIDFDVKDPGADLMSSRFKLTPGHTEFLLWGKYIQPRYSMEFPAQLLESNLDWDDLVLDPYVQDKISELFAWKQFMAEPQNLLANHIKKGFKIIFYGPSGTGKTLTATLLGKKIKMPVYRVDLSGLVSKYVGETTKNLKRIFDLAEMRNYILFFDEGDTIFSKRVDQSQSGQQNASYANQQVAYLLQRIEDYPGVVIVATNLRSNMDEAFSRRFQSTVFFKPPSHNQLIETWQKLWPADQIELSPEIKIDLRLKEHQYTVASLVNIIQRLLLRAHRDNRKIITATEFNQCFKDEQYK